MKGSTGGRKEGAGEVGGEVGVKADGDGMDEDEENIEESSAGRVCGEVGVIGGDDWLAGSSLAERVEEGLEREGGRGGGGGGGRLNLVDRETSCME